MLQLCRTLIRVVNRTGARHKALLFNRSQPRRALFNKAHPTLSEQSPFDDRFRVPAFIVTIIAIIP